MKPSTTKLVKSQGREGSDDNRVLNMCSSLLASCLEVQLTSISKRASRLFTWKFCFLDHRGKSILRNVQPGGTPFMLMAVRHFRIISHLSEFSVV